MKTTAVTATDCLTLRHVLCRRSVGQLSTSLGPVKGLPVAPLLRVGRSKQSLFHEELVSAELVAFNLELT